MKYEVAVKQLIVCAVVGAAAVVSGCDQTVGPADDRIRADAVHVGATAYQLRIGETAAQSVVVAIDDAHYEFPVRRYPWPPDAPPRWSSSDPAVASVDEQGMVTAHHPGLAVLTVDVFGREDSATVRVTSTPAPTGAFSTISTGVSHSCGLTASGEATCWGSSWHGELGLGSARRYTATLSAVGVAVGPTFVAVDAGGLHSCALAADGRAYCWGDNLYGQLGDGSHEASAEATAVVGDLRFARLDAGLALTCGIATSGDTHCWGQLAGAHVTSPMRLATDVRFASVSVGGMHACGLTAAGAAWCWGENTYGQFGGGTGAASVAPVAVAGGHHFRSLSAGVAHTCGVTTTGTALCWGLGTDGRLGHGSEGSSSVPDTVAGAHEFASISAGGTHTCALTTAGSALCWGSNWRGQVGDGTDFGNPELRAADLVVLVPREVQAADERFVTIAAGLGQHSCAITESRASHCWGSNSAGQLGAGSPYQVPGTQLWLSSMPQPVRAPMEAP